MRILLALLCLTAPALAQDGLRDGDTRPSEAELDSYLAGQVIEFYDGSKSRYGRDGSYAYTYTDDDPPWTGRYAIPAPGEVCVDFDNGSRRCDLLVSSGNRMVLVTADGLRFPVRNRSVYNK
ncbi:MAG: hypothetical protein OIF48_17135 [Silicimonas sp.]|nr:hypothetical protein [Silicimonas sp.]